MKKASIIKKIIYLLLIICAVGVSSCSKKVIYSAPAALSQEHIATLSLKKQMAYQFVTMKRKESALLDTILSEGFNSNDQNWRGNKATFVKRRNEDVSFSEIKPIRILHDDSLVAVHSRMFGDTLRFRWDIVRIANEEIHEHWSNVHDSIGLNPDDHSEIDGPTIPQQIEKTDTNRALITRFIDQCMIREDGGASKFFNFGLYIQHNRDVGDGLSGLLLAMLKMKRQGKTIKFKHNYHIIAEGNFVLSATEGYSGNEKTTFYDFFRLEEHKIVEHWDIIAPVDDFLYYDNIDK